MGRLGSTTSVRARQMRRVLARWQRSGLTLREFGQQRGIPLSTLTWWRQGLRRAGEEEVNSAAAETGVRNAERFVWKQFWMTVAVCTDCPAEQDEFELSGDFGFF